MSPIKLPQKHTTQIFYIIDKKRTAAMAILSIFNAVLTLSSIHLDKKSYRKKYIDHQICYSMHERHPPENATTAVL